MGERSRPIEDVQILVYDGVDELDVVAPFEILGAAGFAVELVTAASRGPVRATHGLLLTPDGVLAAAPDLLVVPGGGWVSRAPESAWTEARRGELPAAIAERHAAGSIVAGVCTGVMLLAAGGMLDGRPAITHRAAIDELRETGAVVHPGVRVVDDGDLLTAGGVTSAIDLALHIVERERGEEAAKVGARRIETEVRGPVLESWKQSRDEVSVNGRT
jgi:transcriptional regulator GlxA family with amidase domain